MSERCPVCGGNGLRPQGFYMQTTGTWGAAGTATEKCRACDGRGIIEPQLAGAVQRAEEAEAWAIRLYAMLSAGKKSMVFHEIEPVLIRARGGR